MTDDRYITNRKSTVHYTGNIRLESKNTFIVIYECHIHKR